MTFTFGRTTSTDNYGNCTYDNKYASKYPLSQAGTLQKITALLSVDAGLACSVRFGVYDDDGYGGQPGTLLGYTESIQLPAGTGKHWRTLDMTSPLALEPGDYWLVMHAGSSYGNIYRDPTGGTSNYNWDLFNDGLANPWGDNNSGTRSYCIYGTLTEPNQPPYAPSNLSPTGGAYIDVAQPVTVTWTFGDPDEGDSQSAYEHRYREVGTSEWTTTGWVVSPYCQKIYAGATFTSGKTYEHQCRTKDSQGEIGPWCSSAQFVGTSNPGAPTITDPTNNQTISTSSYEMDWSISDQDAWQARRMEDDQGVPGTTVYEDTGTVEEPTTRSKTWTLTVNDRTEHWQVRVRHDGIWGDWASVKVNISFTPPATPLLEVTVEAEAGRIKLTPTQPTPSGGQPTVVAIHVFRTETDSKDDAIRIAADLDPEDPYYDYQVASSKNNEGLPAYKYFIRAIGDNGATADSDLEG
jgi:hypothetical protein